MWASHQYHYLDFFNPDLSRPAPAGDALEGALGWPDCEPNHRPIRGLIPFRELSDPS